MFRPNMWPSSGIENSKVTFKIQHEIIKVSEPIQNPQKIIAYTNQFQFAFCWNTTYGWNGDTVRGECLIGIEHMA